MTGSKRTQNGVRHKRTQSRSLLGTGVLLASMILPVVNADCIPLRNSTACPAFGEAQISTSNALVDQYPFLDFVSNTTTFDKKFSEYIKEEYVTFKYRSLFGCNNVTTTDTTAFYARFTTTVLCSRMIQDSKTDCQLSNSAATPVCADTCAQFARSEQMIVSNDDTCHNPRQDAIGIIRSDFTICSNPADSLDNSCIRGNDNEKDNCGFGTNLLGLCMYCQDSSLSSTDSCCYSSKAQERCTGVALPTFTNLPPITTATPTHHATAAPGGSSDLSGGAIAGITIGAIAVVAAIAFGLILCWRRKRAKAANRVSIFNRPSTMSPPSMTFTTVDPETGNYETVGGRRVARMSALEGVSDTSSPAPNRVSSRGLATQSSGSEFGYGDSPSRKNTGSPYTRPLHPPPRGRNASLSSSSRLGSMTLSDAPKTASDMDDYDSPQSEQLSYFKDYYSADDIHPGDKVSVLWAYSPRAPDEFELERGDMLKVVGIWDDGWATGIFLNARAEDYIRRREMRDSGVSAAVSSHRRAPSSSDGEGEIKAFPLVCVCLPEHWQKTIENEGQQMAEYSSPYLYLEREQ
ncbi:hypothetical protein FPQ18DRAFT_250703 [Pyronema domesticum]|nr:hypothetical protein FPQ18DRAFT_250703 [Pyronema domesticum]